MAVQMEAARESLKALGFDDRQALIVSHNDTEHPHVHVVVNLVSTENGKFPKLGNDYLKFSELALEYEKRRGVVFCKDREENQQRRKGEFVKDDSMTRQEWQAWKKSQTKDIWDSFRADRAKVSAPRKGQFDALWRQKDERFAQRKEEIKAVFKPQWQQVFKQQRTELKNFDAGFFDRLGFALGRTDRSKVIGALQAITSDGNLRAEFVRKQELERRQLGDRHKARVADASREVRKAWKYDHDQLKASHEAEDQRRYDSAKTQSDEVWKTDTANTSKPDFEDTANVDETAEKPRSTGFLDGHREKRTRKRPRRRPR